MVAIMRLVRESFEKGWLWRVEMPGRKQLLQQAAAAKSQQQQKVKSMARGDQMQNF